MKKIILGLLFVAIIASAAVALPDCLCIGYAYVNGTIADGWTISANITNTGTYTTDSYGYFYITRATTPPSGTKYYLIATKQGQQTKYTGWLIFNGYCDDLGNVSFTRTSSPPLD